MKLYKSLKGTEAPCKGCECRHRACQDTCSKFAEFKSKREAEKKAYHDYRLRVVAPPKLIGGMDPVDYQIKKGVRR